MALLPPTTRTSPSHIQGLPGKTGAACAQMSSAACVHGTFVAGILSAKRDSAAPAICPDCTLLVNPVFSEMATGSADQPSATPEELAAAILECIEADARIVNLSLAVTRSSSKGERALKLALDHAARLGVIIVAAAGNQGTVGGTVITAHPWVIAVAACDANGKPLNGSNLGSSIGLRGLRAPGDGVTSLGADGRSLTLGGTSVGCAVRDRRCRPGVVPATGGERSPNSPGVPTGARSRTSLRDAPAAGCVGRLPTRDREVSHDRR